MKYTNADNKTKHTSDRAELDEFFVYALRLFTKNNENSISSLW